MIMGQWNTVRIPDCGSDGVTSLSLSPSVYSLSLRVKASLIIQTRNFSLWIEKIQTLRTTSNQEEWSLWRWSTDRSTDNCLFHICLCDKPLNCNSNSECSICVSVTIRQVGRLGGLYVATLSCRNLHEVMWGKVFRRAWKNSILTLKHISTKMWLFRLEYIWKTTEKLQNDIIN